LTKCLDEIDQLPDLDRPKFKLRSQQQRTAEQGGRLVGPRLAVTRPMDRRVSSEPSKKGTARSSLRLERRSDIPELLNALAIATFQEDSDSELDAVVGGEKPEAVYISAFKKSTRALARERKKASDLEEGKKGDTL
jgi:hypothetical protein